MSGLTRTQAQEAARRARLAFARLVLARIEARLGLASVRLSRRLAVGPRAVTPGRMARQEHKP